jgi:periplasmic copper chaperone A
MRTTISIACVVVALAAPTVAQAHITLQPTEAPADTFTSLAVGVTNARDYTSTIKVAITLPLGLVDLATQPIPGWTVKRTKTKAAETVTWTGHGKQGEIGRGELQDFGLSFAVPNEPGTDFPVGVVQNYRNGELSQWLHEPRSDGPPPHFSVVKAAAAPAPEPAARAPVKVQTAATTGDDGDGMTWLALIALVLAALGLLVAVVKRRRYVST